MSFDSLGLSDALLSAVRAKGYETPSPIQAKAIPVILDGRDILAAAQTGTGKTAGFTLPMLQLLNEKPIPSGKRPIRSLIVTPTRELAAQIYDNILEYGKNLDLRSVVIFGGVPANPQIRKLKDGIDILVATPGRLLDLHNQRYVDLSQVEFLVLDEADRMLDMGFIHDIKKLIALLPVKRQSLLFSATFSDDIRKLSRKFMNDPVSVDVAPRNTAAESVKQTVYPVHKKRKAELLKHLILTNDWQQVLVFTRTKHGANRLAKRLDRANISAMAIHGNKSQGARTKALQNFKDNRVRVLVATDIAARGIDIEELPWVVNYELPNVSEDYVHRIGRTGRAGLSGEAISLVHEDEIKLLRGIERLLKKSIPQETLKDFDYTVRASEDDRDERPDRSLERGGGRGRGGNRNNRGGRNDRSRRDDRDRNDRPDRRNRNESNEKSERPNRSEKPRRENTSKEKEPQKATNQEGTNNDRKNDKPESEGKKNNRNNRNRNRNRNKKKSKDSDKTTTEGGNKKQKGVSFAKASKKKPMGKKGPIGYGMYPLE